ncbi:MAG: hypothetical protein RLZZ117_223 [Cyanobacteriota bacterium]|jgi:GNAT superfamily N-acetyltransferase
MPSFHIGPLDPSHGLDGFDCGDAALHRFLQLHAWLNRRANASRTYLAVNDRQVVGYYTLVVGEVAPEGAPERIRKGLARHPVPLMVLARLAVDRDDQGQGLGAGLLKDAMMRILAAAEIAGIRALAVHAKDERARGFYSHFGFIASPTDPLHLFVLLKDLRALAG